MSEKNQPSTPKVKSLHNTLSDMVSFGGEGKNPTALASQPGSQDINGRLMRVVQQIQEISRRIDRLHNKFD